MSSSENPQISINLSFDEASVLLKPEVINRNQSLLNQSMEYIENPLDKCEFPEVDLIPVISSVFFIPPESLIDRSLPLLIDIKKDIIFLKQSYGSVAKEINKCIELTNQAMKNLYQPSLAIKNEIGILREKFKQSIISLSEPLAAKEKGIQTNFKTDNLLEKDKKEVEKEKNKIIKEVQKFREESINLIQQQNNIFKEISLAVSNFAETVCNLQTPVKSLRERVETGCGEIEEVLGYFNDLKEPQEFHDNIIKLKKPLEDIYNEIESTHQDTDKRIILLKDEFDRRNITINKLNLDNKNKILMFQNNKDKICESIQNLREKYKQSKINYNNKKIELINAIKICEELNVGVKKINTSVSVINTEIKKVENNIDDIIKEMKMDLLFIMDLTGSMDPFVSQAQEKMILIIESIQKKCPGAEINIGFVGYRDFVDYEKEYECVVVDFVKNVEEVITQIKGIDVFGGGDTCEDLTGALEISVGLKWKNRARYAILVTDAPCHGSKYHDGEIDDYPEGDPLKRDPVKLVRKLAKAEVSFFCMKITDKTNIIYDLFEGVYIEEKNKGKKIIFGTYVLTRTEPEELCEIISESATKVYKGVREESIINSCRI